MSNVRTLIKSRALLLGTVAVLALGGAGLALNRGSAPASAAPPAATAAVPVNVQTVAPKNVRIWSEFSGRLQAVDYAEVRPEVNGRITEVRFKDGQDVKAGDVLFVIDPRPYEAAVAKAEANLASAQTSAALAKTELDRAQNLMKTQDIAQTTLDARVNTVHVTDAAIQAAAADLKQAKVDLDHAYVKSPISGRVSRAEITVGNLVQSTAVPPPVLTSVVSRDGIYADFEVDEQTYLKSIRAQANTQAKEQQIPVELSLPGDDHTYQGNIWSFDNRLNSGTGTIRARARFDNKDGSLTPGMFVSVKLAGAEDATVLLVPDRAIGNDQSKKFVYVVNGENKVAYREVTLGATVDGRRVVASGLQAGERVIVDGLQHVRPDALVQAVEADAAAPSAIRTAAAPKATAQGQ